MRLESSLPVSVWPASFLRLPFLRLPFLRRSLLHRSFLRLPFLRVSALSVLGASVLLLLLGSSTTAAHARSGQDAVFDIEQSDRFTDPSVTPFGGASGGDATSGRTLGGHALGGRAQGDTIWFGGHDGAGYAVEGSVWDFEGGAAGDFQGWTSIDCTENLDTYFGRVTAEHFATDPVVPMFNAPDSQGQIWCGVHEAEANELGFITGMAMVTPTARASSHPPFRSEPSRLPSTTSRTASSSGTTPMSLCAAWMVWAIYCLTERSSWRASPGSKARPRRRHPGAAALAPSVCRRAPSKCSSSCVSIRNGVVRRGRSL